ncbi:MAG: hypothetical protein ACXVZP_12245 [Gaiellaceae bacterium]
MQGGRTIAPDGASVDAVNGAASPPSNGAAGDPQWLAPLSSETAGASPPLEAISPELILVSPPEIARLARELLPELPPSYRSEPPATIAPLLPLPPAAPSTVMTSVAGGVMDASLETPYSGSQLLRGGVALAVAAAIFAATGLAAERSWRRTAAAPLPVLTRSAPVPATSGVAGVAVTRGHPSRSSTKRRKPTATTSATVPPRSTKGAASTATRKSNPGAGPQRSKPTSPAAGSTQTSPAGPRRPAQPRGGTFIPSRVFAWAAAPGASSYRILFFWNGHQALSVTSSTPKLKLPAGFRFQAGSYRWQVVPLVSGKPGRPLVDSTFTLSAATAARANRG